MPDKRIDFNAPQNWKYKSPTTPGLHEVISPENSACKLTWIWRLNLEKGKSLEFQQNSLEINAVLIQGKLQLNTHTENYSLSKLDSFYLPAGEALTLTAEADCFLYMGGAPYEEAGEFFVRQFDPDLSEGDIMQVHGQTPYKRNVFMTLNQEVPASRLICGITRGEPGKWTSWPPHQHTKDLEEVYCYFDIPDPKKAFHFASRKAGEFEYVHPVSTGDCVVIPQGYHPTCAMPGVSSTYFWVMAAFSAKSRRYDLAVNDPNFG